MKTARPPGVAAASWLTEDALLLVATSPPRRDATLLVSLQVEGREIEVPAAVFELPLPGEEGHHGRGDLIAAALPSVGQAEATLRVRAENLAYECDMRDLRWRPMGLQALLRRFLAPLSSDVRAEVVQFLANEAPIRSSSTLITLSKRLHAVREALRERVPEHTPSFESPLGLHIDGIVAADPRSFWVRGWLHEGEADAVRLTAVAPDGQRAALLSRLFRYPRPDVAQFYAPACAPDASAGFLCFFELRHPSPLPTGWVFELEDREGTAIEVHAQRVVTDASKAERVILDDLLHELPEGDQLLREHAYPALTRLGRQRDAVEIRRVAQFGTPPVNPDVSVVVPIYRRIDLVESQLATLADDPDFQRCDLIYVLDSPELERQLLDYSGELNEIYRVPFRVVILERHQGFAGANNAGVSIARGRLLLLLNSDVMASGSGWLSAMARFYDATPGIGALGPKLLFEDDSLQHAGIYFHRAPAATVWENAHYFKGLHRTLPAANVTRPVPAVTGACLMIARALYERLDGLRGLYVQGDYEDSDLCLRLLQAGLTNWYLPDVELYHLEGQSYDLDTRLRNGRYNTWLHTYLWHDAIAEVMAQRYEPGSPPNEEAVPLRAAR